jgi:hypothetical protein
VSALDDPVLPATALAVVVEVVAVVVEVVAVVAVAAVAVAAVAAVVAGAVDAVVVAGSEADAASWVATATAPLRAANPAMLAAPTTRRARRAGWGRRRFGGRGRLTSMSRSCRTDL